MLLESILAPCSSFVHDRQAGSQRTVATWVLAFLHIALVPAVVIACYVSGFLSRSNHVFKADHPLQQAVGTLKWLRDDSPKFDTIGRCRLAGAAIFLAVACIYDLAAIYTKVSQRLVKWRSAIFLFVITALTVSFGFRLSLSFSSLILLSFRHPLHSTPPTSALDFDFVAHTYPLSPPFRRPSLSARPTSRFDT